MTRQMKLRLKHARAVLLQSPVHIGGNDREAEIDAITDCMTNLLHLANQKHYSVASILNSVNNHYLHEQETESIAA